MIDFLMMIAGKILAIYMIGCGILFVVWTTWAVYLDTKSSWKKYIRRKIHEHEEEQRYGKLS